MLIGDLELSIRGKHRLLPDRHRLVAMLYAAGQGIPLVEKSHRERLTPPWRIKKMALSDDSHQLDLAISFLEENTLARMAQVFKEGASFLWGTVPTRIERQKLDRIATIEQLRIASPTDLLVIEFVSPVVFRRGHDTLAWPEVESVFGSLRYLWETFVGPINVAKEHFMKIEIREIEGTRKRVPLRFGAWGIEGYTGRVTYDLRPLSAAMRQEITMLARYGQWSGIGWKRAWGLGGLVVRFPQSA